MSITISIDAVDQGAGRVIAALARDEEKVAEKFQKLASESSKGAREWNEGLARTSKSFDEVNRAASRGAGVFRKHRDEAERLKDGLADLRKARDEGRISEEQYNRTVARLITKEQQRKRVIKQSNQTLDERNQVLNRANRSEEEFGRIERRVAGLIQKSETAQERYNSDIKALAVARRAGTISEEQYSRTVTELVSKEQQRQRVVRESNQAAEEQNRAIEKRHRTLKRANRTEEEFERIERRVTGLVRKSETAQERYNRDIEALVVARRAGTIAESDYARGVARSRANLEKYHSTSDRTFGPQMVDRISKHFAAFASGAAAVNLVREAIEYYKRELDEATGTSNTLSDSRKRLSQVAESSDDLAGLERQADRISTAEGIERSATREFLFSARSEGFEDQADEIARRSQVISLDTLGKISGQIRDLFGGELTSVEAIEAVFAGARASRSSTEDIASALPQVAAGGRRIGAGATEQIGALSVLSSLYKSPEQAAARISAFQSRVALKGEEFGVVTDGGLLEAVRSVEGLDKASLRNFLGDSKEVNEAFADLSGKRAEIVDRANFVADAVQRTGTGNELTRQARENKFTNSASGAIERSQLAARRAKIADEISQERHFAEKGFGTQETISDVRRGLRDAGVGSVGRMAAERGAGANRILGGSKVEAKIAGTVYGTAADALARELTPESIAGRMITGTAYGKSADAPSGFLETLAGRIFDLAGQQIARGDREAIDRNTEALDRFTSAVQTTASPTSGEPGKDR